jgi:hypothetical protein
MNEAVGKRAFSANVTIFNCKLLFLSKLLLFPTYSAAGMFARTVCQEVTYKWNNEMSHLAKKMKPHLAAGGEQHWCGIIQFALHFQF